MLSVQETRQLDRLTIHGASNASPAASTNLRRAAAAGHGLDFHDFRHYQPGDDPRRIDWTIAARHRQLVVRQFHAEGHIRVHVLVDISRSMTLGRPAKMACAMKLASALSYIAAHHDDAVGVATFDRRLTSHVPAATGRPHLFRVLETLEEAVEGGESDIDRVLQSYGGIAAGPGLAVVLSDFLQPGLTLDGARYLLYRGLTPALVQIVSDDELEPGFREDEDTIELVDVERRAARPLLVGRTAVAAYQRRMTVLTAELRQFCATRGLPWMQTVSSSGFEQMLDACVRAGLLATAA